MCDKMLASTTVSSEEIFNMRNARGQTSLHHMIQWRPNQKFISHVVEKGAAPDARDESARTLLHDCVYQSAHDSIKGLIAVGAMTENLDFFGNTPLALAFSRNDCKTAWVLIEQGATLTTKSLENAFDCFGMDKTLAIYLEHHGNFSTTKMSKLEFANRFHLGGEV